MRALVALCVRRCGAIAALTLLALVLGTWGALRSPLDVFPEFVPSQVDIQTEAPGFSPQQVEELVTKRVESAVNGAEGLATLRSESIPGLSVITISFNAHIDLLAARQGISERLSEIGSSLPAGVGTPKLSPLVSSTMDLLKVGLVSDTVDAYTLRDTADWLLKPRLLAVPGVAKVIDFGGAVRQIQIQPDPHKLASFKVSFGDVADGARAALALRGAGFIDIDAQRILLKSPTPKPDIGAIGQAVITVRNNVPLRIRDVAAVVEAPALRSGDALINGKPGVLMALASQYGANTLTTTLAVEQALGALEPALRAQGITVYGDLHRPANFIERALHDLQDALIIASILILAVLYLFLRDLRGALIAFIAIPLSLLAAVLLLGRMGQTLNTMTLGGFAVALGVLVDDAIIGIENILRRLRANAAVATPRPRLDVIRDASLEVRGPVIYATVVVIAVFLPELLASNVEGRFVGPLALAFVLAVLASLLVAMTATPALCALFLHDEKPHAEARWILWIKARQTGIVCWVSAHSTGVAVLLGAAFVATLAAVPFLGGTFMPDFREGHFVVQASSAIPGTSLEEMLAMGRQVSAQILRLPYVRSVSQQVGRAELGEDTWGPHRSEFHVELNPEVRVDEADAQQALRRILAARPGVQSEVVTFLGDRISESLTGDTAQVAVKVFGEDLDGLDTVGNEIVKVLEGVPGIVDLQFKRQSGTPALQIELHPAALAATGLRNEDVLRTIQSAYAGETVGQTYIGARSVDAVLIMPEVLRHRPERLQTLAISGPYGPVALGQVATVALTADRYSIAHEGGQRRVTVTFNTSGRGLQAVVGDARRLLASRVRLPPGFFVEFTGAAAAESAARVEIALYSGIALALILTVLFVAFRWRSNAWLVMVNLPFSLIGGVLAIALSGIGISVGSLVGLVTVFGISARNAILQLAHYEHLVEVEGTPWSLEVVLRGANERLIPILMTAAVTALGLLPLALAIHRPGQEIGGPMAVTVLGGLLTSTVLNLLVLPSLAARYATKTRAA
jgi:CzcA family heavy metal efflux pump